MSRKWSPGAEVARDKLFDQLMSSGLPAGERWQLIDDFAHALAEQQRDWAEHFQEAELEGERITHEQMVGAQMAADWIDPDPPERPVSSEETTP